MSEESDIKDRTKRNGSLETYRIRRNEVVGIITIPVFLTIIGMLVSFIRGIYTDSDSRITRLRTEFRQEIQQHEDTIYRELEKVESRSKEEIRRIERWLIQVQEGKK